jgi:hypothetical protein
MNPVTVSKTRTVDSKASDRKWHKQDDAEPECRPIRLLSVLEAENSRLRQAVLEIVSRHHGAQGGDGID